MWVTLAIGHWTGLPNTAEHSARKADGTMAVLGPVFWNSTTCRWSSWSLGLIETLTWPALALKWSKPTWMNSVAEALVPRRDILNVPLPGFCLLNDWGCLVDW